MDARAAGLDVVNLNLGALFTEDIAAVSLDGRGATVLVLWSGLGCDREATLTVSPANAAVTVSPEPIENCELIGSYRDVILMFAEAPLRLNLETTPIVEPS